MANEQQLLRLRNFNSAFAKYSPQLEVYQLPDQSRVVSGRAAVDANEALAIESAILRDHRPILTVRHGQVDSDGQAALRSHVWSAQLSIQAPLLEYAVESVGRIELRDSFFDWVGTGWLVTDNILVTNRHVAEVFAQRFNDSFTFLPGNNGLLAVVVDFGQELAKVQQSIFSVTKILHIESAPGPDVAFLEIEMRADSGRLLRPISLSPHVRPDQKVVTIGHIAFDPRIADRVLIEQIYGVVHDKKTIAPGHITNIEGTLFGHDCTTLGGNSGAVILDLQTGEAVGLQASGRFLSTNYALRADVIKNRLADLPRRTQIAGKVFRSLKILSIELENIRCFPSITIDFSESGQPRPWTMLLGDNGLGKTTVLRSIALALSDQTSASSLMARMPGELLHHEMSQGYIRVRLSSPDLEAREIWTETKLTRSSDNGIELSQTTSQFFPRESLFICGYGALRNGFGNESYAGYAVADAVASLFDPKSLLQNPELALRRLMSAGVNMDRICRQIEKVLRLPVDSTQFSLSGLAIKGSWGSFVPIGAIGDGYLATLAWLSDLLGWTFLYRSTFIEAPISGIVLIDELEKHLHPRWQREIVLELSRQFPEIQFIVSSHSPLCAGGLSDLECGEAAMYRFEREADMVSAEKLEPYRGWTYDQIMTSSAFGLQATRDITTQNIVDELSDARAIGDYEKAKTKEQALKLRSIIAADEQRDAQLQEKLRRDIEELQRVVTEKSRDRGAAS